MATDFLIVGGGIGGLVLAELLGRGGKRVVVLERSTGPPPWSRPEILWPATFELLCRLLPQAEWVRQAMLPLEGMELFDGQMVRWAVSPQILATAGVQPWSTDPNQTREVLMTLRSFELQRGVEVQEVLKHDGRIVGARGVHTASGQAQEWLAEWTVGDDGVHSLVRAGCGIELATQIFPLDLMCFQFSWPPAFRPRAGRLWPNVGDSHSGILAAGIVPIPDGRGVGIVPTRPELVEDPPRAQAAWRRLVESEASLSSLLGERRFPDDFQRVRRPWGHAPRYGAAGALLIGDAAHPVSPAGGQGANMSIADARTVAELALGGERDLLAAYERRRRPANRRSMRFTRATAFAFGLPEGLIFNRLSAWLLAQVGSRPPVAARFVRTLATAFLE
jgi:2-polyprenyl-6-methoxyphenol hydroxylase-like FAD-dependent oxidoreductase